MEELICEKNFNPNPGLGSNDICLQQMKYRMLSPVLVELGRNLAPVDENIKTVYAYNFLERNTEIAISKSVPQSTDYYFFQHNQQNRKYYE